jgi:fatty acid desaturase
MARSKGTQAVRRAVRYGEHRLRQQYPILAHQDAIGAMILGGSGLGMLISGGLYLAGVIPAWVCIVVTAFLASLVHEIEHDLIHALYFRKSRQTRNFMLYAACILKGNAPRPAVRQKSHINHHGTSGKRTDYEERYLGLGLPMGLRRLLTFDMFIGSLLNRRTIKKDVPMLDFSYVLRSILPTLAVFFVLWHAFLAAAAVRLLGESMVEGVVWSAVDAAWPFLKASAVVWVLPNVLRQFCLQLVTTSIHYYGDVNGVAQETQVIDHWLYWPFQVFCFNFGGTHAIHHYVVDQPFYLRQLTAGIAHKAMRKHGVRFNDLSAILRKNAYARVETASEKPFSSPAA